MGKEHSGRQIYKMDRQIEIIVDKGGQNLSICCRYEMNQQERDLGSKSGKDIRKQNVEDEKARRS